jgi:hypothetical protein
VRAAHLQWHRADCLLKRRGGWLMAFVSLGALLMLTSCGAFGSVTQTKSAATPTATDAPPTPTPTPDPYAWVWNIGVPANRLVLYYYIPGAPWGFVGTYTDSSLLARIQEQSQQYAELDPAHPVVSGLDIVSPVAEPSPGPDGYYSAFTSPDIVQHYLNLATQQHMLFFLDMQIGRAPLQPEVDALWQYLQIPNVELALDPEFDVAPYGVPDANLGHMMAAQINPVIDELSRLVATRHLPPKILIIHQWQESMLPDWQNIRLQPGVSVITCSDGFGTPAEKLGDYQQFDNVQLIQYPGIKLFYPNFPGNPPHPTLDTPLLSPADVLKLHPVPILIMYQ